MMGKPIVALIVVLVIQATAEAAVIRGRIAQLDGTPIDEINKFQVVATNGNQQVSQGSKIINGTVQPTNPDTVLAPVLNGPGSRLDYLQFSVEIDDEELLRQDHRITLTFTATGRETVTLFGIAGNLDQSIDVILPIAKVHPGPTCCNPCHQYYYYPSPTSCYVHRRPRITLCSWFHVR